MEKIKQTKTKNLKETYMYISICIYQERSRSNTVDDHTDSIINGRPDHTDKKTKTEIKAHYGKD